MSATRVTEETLYQLAQNAPMLSHLDLTSCVKAVSDSSLQVDDESFNHNGCSVTMHFPIFNRSFGNRCGNCVNCV